MVPVTSRIYNIIILYPYCALYLASLMDNVGELAGIVGSIFSMREPTANAPIRR